MCMEDIKIGRNIATGFKGVAGNALSVSIIATPSINRVSLLISSGGLQIVRITPQPGPTITNMGFTLTTANPVLELNLMNAGSMLYGAWLAEFGAVADTVTVLDNTLDARNASELR